MRRAAEPHRLALRDYYEDTDFSGSVYHASYLRFLERARTELLRALGVEHTKLIATGDPGGCHFVVLAMSLEFLKPAFMDDLLSVETGVCSLGGASIEMKQVIRRAHEVLLTADLRIALVGGGRPRRIPAEILDKLRPSLASLAAAPPNCE